MHTCIVSSHKGILVLHWARLALAEKVPKIKACIGVAWL